MFPLDTRRAALCCLTLSTIVYLLFSYRPRSTSSPVMSSKRGLCWDTKSPDPVHTFTKPGSKISWLYNWSPDPTPNAHSLTFIPMQWNGVSIDDLQSKLLSSRATTVLGFNEPNHKKQANMTPTYAAAEWVRVIEPLRQSGIRCGSPAITNGPGGVPWLLEFLSLIHEQGSDVDFYVFHAYMPDVGALFDYLWSAYYQMPDQNKKVWLTEYACTNWDGEKPMGKEHVMEFARKSWEYFDNELEWLEKYAWFGPLRDVGTVGKWARLLDDDGRLTELGKLYRDGA